MPKIALKRQKMHFFEKKLPKNLVMSKKSSTFAPAFEKQSIYLVR